MKLYYNNKYKKKKKLNIFLKRNHLIIIYIWLLQKLVVYLQKNSVYNGYIR